jgi:hypothetical protein
MKNSETIVVDVVVVVVNVFVEEYFERLGLERTMRE